MAHQYMPKIFHGPHKNPPAPTPTYLMYGPLSNTLLSLQQVIHFFFEHLVLKTLLTSVGIVSYKRLFLKNHNINQINHNHIYVIAIVKFSNRSIQNLFNNNVRTCLDSCKLYYFYWLGEVLPRCRCGS